VTPGLTRAARCRPKVPLFSDDPTAKVAGLMWYNMVEGLVDPQVHPPCRPDR
jgi:hypothetical protein